MSARSSGGGIWSNGDTPAGQNGYAGIRTSGTRDPAGAHRRDPGFSPPFIPPPRQGVRGRGRLCPSGASNHPNLRGAAGRFRQKRRKKTGYLTANGKTGMMHTKIPDASSARAAFSRSGRIENRVRIPDGTAAVCAEGRLTLKNGHWETGKASRSADGNHSVLRVKSEDLLEVRLVLFPRIMGKGIL